MAYLLCLWIFAHKPGLPPTGGGARRPQQGQRSLSSKAQRSAQKGSYSYIRNTGTGLIKVPKKLVSTSKSAYVSMSNESILQINIILTSSNLVLTFYNYKVSNNKVSS
jgi:hypothetical protein